MDVSQIKVGSIKLIEEEPKLRDLEASKEQAFSILESERFDGETVPYVSLYHDRLHVQNVAELRNFIEDKIQVNSFSITCNSAYGLC